MGSIYLRFPQGRAKALTLSYDDGVVQDVQLMQIMDRNGLKGTFNLNSGTYPTDETVWPDNVVARRLTLEQATKQYKNSGHEVAVHGFTHAYLEQLPVYIAAQEVLDDRRNLEQQFGTLVRGMAYPFGTTSDGVVDVLKNAGIAYARTTVSTETFDIPTDWLRLPATCHHNNPRLMELANRFVTQKAERAPWLFYLWGHSYEFDINDNWQVIEQFAQETGGHEDIWYATNIEIYDYIEAYHQLRFSVDKSRIYNPSVQEVWLEMDGQPLHIGAGQTLVLH